MVPMAGVCVKKTPLVIAVFSFALIIDGHSEHLIVSEAKESETGREKKLRTGDGGDHQGTC